MALRVLLQIETKPGCAEEFERLWREHAQYVSTVPDNHGQWLYRRTDRPDSYVVLTDWTDEVSFRAFEHSEAQQSYLKRLWPLRAGGSMAFLEVVTDHVALSRR